MSILLKLQKYLEKGPQVVYRARYPSEVPRPIIKGMTKEQILEAAKPPRKDAVSK